MKRPATLFALAALFPTTLLTAQSEKSSTLEAGAYFESTPIQQQGVGTEPVEGRIPGTHRYNVTFNTRSFDLEGFRRANLEKAEPAAVAAIVEDLKARAHADYAEFRAAVEALGGAVNIEFWLINACNIDLPDSKLAQVQALANVLDVRADLPTYPLIYGAAPVIKVATDANHHNADAEQAIGNSGTSVGVAIVDTSADSSLHGANQPHMVYYRNGDRNNHTAPGLDGSRLMGAFAMGAQPANNSHPHGTGVAGIAAGAGWNTVGADRGHSSDARVIVYSICDAAGSCNSSFATEAAGWQQVAADAAAFGTVTANMSYGSSPSPTDVSQQAIDACAINAGVLPVCAAGNNGSSTAGSSSTANGLAVAAIDPTNKTVAGFSSRGPMSGDTSRFYPDISACGVNTVMPQYGNESVDWVASGTSMASPQVCGAAGLVKNARPASTPLELKALLLNNTESIVTQNPGLDRNAFGLGFLRDDITCSAARNNQVFSSTINSTSVPKTHTMSAIQNQIYVVTLSWHRHILTSTGWSNLALKIKNGATVIASSDTPRNLYEKVEFTSPITGNLTIEVSASGLEIPNLPYAVAFGLSSANGLASVTLSGSGCVASSATFYELFSANTFDMSGRGMLLTPSGGGYLALPLTASIVPPTSTGLALTDDSLSPPLNLPFTFNHPSGSTNQVIVCSNGFIYLNGSGTSNSYVPDVVDALTGGPRLFSAWTDLRPDGATNVNNVFYESDPANNRALITWRNVPEYSNTGAHTLQVQIYGTGEVRYIWQSLAISAHDLFVGYSPGNNGRDPGSRDISATLPFSTGPDRIPLAQDATRPLIGGTCQLLANDIPAGSTLGVELLGIQSAGLDLTAVGMPTCFLYLNPIITSLPFAAGGSSASTPLGIPNNAALLGAQVGVQAATITPGLNQLGVATSNLAVLGIGQF